MRFGPSFVFRVRVRATSHSSPHPATSLSRACPSGQPTKLFTAWPDQLCTAHASNTGRRRGGSSCSYYRYQARHSLNRPCVPVRQAIRRYGPASDADRPLPPPHKPHARMRTCTNRGRPPQIAVAVPPRPSTDGCRGRADSTATASDSSPCRSHSRRPLQQPRRRPRRGRTLPLLISIKSTWMATTLT